MAASWRCAAPRPGSSSTARSKLVLLSPLTRIAWSPSWYAARAAALVEEGMGSASMGSAAGAKIARRRAP